MDIQDNKGVIFKNRDKDKSNANYPDYKGQIKVDGMPF